MCNWRYMWAQVPKPKWHHLFLHLYRQAYHIHNALTTCVPLGFWKREGGGKKKNPPFNECGKVLEQMERCQGEQKITIFYSLCQRSLHKHFFKVSVKVPHSGSELDLTWFWSVFCSYVDVINSKGNSTLIYVEGFF